MVSVVHLVRDVLMALVIFYSLKGKGVVAFATIRANFVRAGPSTSLRFAQDDICGDTLRGFTS